MTQQANLIEIVGELGRPPANVDIETFAIARLDPTELRAAIKRGSPSYEDMIQMRDGSPDLYKFITEVPQPEIGLGNSIASKQQRLSRVRRTAATVLTTIALGTGMGALTYAAKDDVRNNNPSVVKQDPNKKDQLATSVGAGGIAGIAGGLIVHLSGFAFAHRLARRPAEKIVRKAKQRNQTI